jgi:hypothetical protein
LREAFPEALPPPVVPVEVPPPRPAAPRRARSGIFGWMGRRRRARADAVAPPEIEAQAPPRRVPSLTFREVPAPKPIGAEMARLLDRLEHWCDRLLSSPSADGADEEWLGREPRPTGTILDAIAPGWDLEIARMCAEDARAEWLSPSRWVEALLAELDRPQRGLPSLDRAFAQHVAESWLDDKPLESLITTFRPSPDWLTRFFEQGVVPFWRSSARDRDLESGVVALDEQTWRLAGREGRDGPNRFLRLKWPVPYTAALVRLVQGIAPDGPVSTGPRARENGRALDSDGARRAITPTSAH